MDNADKILAYNLIQNLILERFTEGHVYDPVAASKNMALRITHELDEQGFTTKPAGDNNE